MQNRAYSVLTVKSIDEDMAQRLFAVIYKDRILTVGERRF